MYKDNSILFSAETETTATTRITSSSSYSLLGDEASSQPSSRESSALPVPSTPYSTKGQVAGKRKRGPLLEHIIEQTTITRMELLW